MSFYNKKGQVSSTLVLMIASLIGLVILLGVTGTFGKVFKSVTDKSDCQMQFLISSITKTGGVQAVDPDCEPHKITITQNNLTDERKINRVKKDLMDYGIKQNGNDVAQEYVSYFENDETRQEWILNEYIAKEMKYCWDVTGQGKLDLFSDWSIFQCGKDKHPCTYNEIKSIYTDNKLLELIASGAGVYVGGIFGGVIMGSSAPLLLNAMMGDLHLAERPPTFCVLCSRIKFSDMPARNVNSMSMWLANNPVSNAGTGSKIPYSAYLQNDNFKGIFAKGAYQYSTDKNLAVLYQRINVFEVQTWADKISEFITFSDGEVPKDIQVVNLVPYEDLKNQCTFLVG